MEIIDSYLCHSRPELDILRYFVFVWLSCPNFIEWTKTTFFN